MERVITKYSISAQAAQRMITTAETKASELGMAISSAIVDESGIIKAFSRMDGAPLISVNAAMKKAITAVGFGMNTGEEWYSFIKDDPILLYGSQSFENFTLLGGGIPIVVDEQRVGAIGVSGGHYVHDEQCAAAAIDAMLSSLP